MKIRCQLDRSVIPVGQAGEVNLMVRLLAPYAKNTTRKPVNICLVLDISASMAGAKLEHTKIAVCRIIDNLRPEDLISVVLFSADARTLIEPVHPEHKDELKQRVMAISSEHNTNLSAGWLKGIEKIMFNAQGSYISRVLLLTDGEANEGVTETPDLVAIGRGQGRLWRGKDNIDAGSQKTIRAYQRG